MRSRLIFLASTVFIAGTFISGCNMLDKKPVTSQDKVQEAKVNVVDASMALNQSFEQFKLKSDYAIATNEKRIRDLKFKSAAEKDENSYKSLEDKGENKANYDKQVAALELKNTELKMKLTNYKEDNNWEAFKTEFNHEMNELGKAVGDLTVKSVN